MYLIHSLPNALAGPNPMWRARIRQPLAVSVWEYAMFAVQGGSAVGLIVIAACALAVKYNNIAAATGQRPCLDFIVPPDFCCRSDRTAEQRQCAARQHPVKKPHGMVAKPEE